MSDNSSKSSQRILSKGDIVNDTYTVRFFIGQGAFGEVYRVEHCYLGTQVLKVFKEEYSSKTDIEAITREARILSKLTHPNIVRVFETNTFTKDGVEHFFVTMGFVSGETLARLLGRERIALPIALRIQQDFLSGLAVAHEQDPPIIHRDISPDNILLSYEDSGTRAMISDFGLAQITDYQMMAARAAGKLAYFAPECFWDVYLPASDVFSAGIVLYQMLTGLHPWEYDFDQASNYKGDTSTVVIAARKKKPRKPSFYNTLCSKRVDAVVMKSLDENLETRFKSGGDFLEALSKVSSFDKAFASTIGVSEPSTF